MVVIFPNQIGGVLFCTVMLGGLEQFEITPYRTGVDAIPEGYITNFQILEVYINSIIVDISVF